MQIINDFDLTPHNTFGLVSRAQYATCVTSNAELTELAAFATKHRLPLHVIGSGSDLLPRGQVAGVIAIIATKGRSIIAEKDGCILVRAMAGENWSDFVEWTVRQGHDGLENLAGIPGTVGAAPVQNIGAYGLELRDRFLSLTAFDTVENKLFKFDREACLFRYRQSIFRTTARYIIVDVTLALPRPWRPLLGYKGLDDLSPEAGAVTVMSRVLELRRQKLPDWRVLGNAGSFFHNPVVSRSVAGRITDAPRYVQADGRVKLSAAWLVEACGLKGAREGQAGIYDDHALIVVNHGGATFGEVSRIAARVRGTVLARFGVELVQEPISI
jgi:UDP-N-acetylmuramate dehydrogenase